MDQFRSTIEPEDVEMEEELGNEEQEENYEVNSESEQSMEENSNELQEEIDEIELRPRSSIKKKHKKNNTGSPEQSEKYCIKLN